MRVARRSPVGARYRDAWVLCDRDVQAHDNAEHLYRYLAAERPDINAWFALSRRSPDYARLKREGFRLLDYGSWRHQPGAAERHRLNLVADRSLHRVAAAEAMEAFRSVAPDLFAARGH
ncbi:hypothetical protein [Demequina litorisediminis]|uniref:hypothetical protein n=1 Tax=Demequina litorisediminis TaxID=1849022 RepID=UPI0024E0521D|nr:hypothetical protein [Demequina litorisediminis]